MRFVRSLALVFGASALALGGACVDLFHGTHWDSLCDRNPSAPSCGTGGGGGAGPGTTSHTSTHASTGGMGAGGTGGGVVDPCPGYCNDVLAACPTQYDDESSCLHVCALLPADAPPPSTGDIVCRAAKAKQAMNDPMMFCGAAGPTGGNVCGSPCSAYCAIMTARCGADTTNCAADCASFDMSVAYDDTVTTGNSFACRFHWAVVAVDQTMHCVDASTTSMVCVDADM